MPFSLSSALFLISASANHIVLKTYSQKYLPDDLKGKGEPAYSLEKALKSHKASHRRNASDGNPNAGIEMSPNSTSASRPGLQYRPTSADAVGDRSISEGQRYSDWEGGLRRSESGAGKLRKRIENWGIRNKE